MADQSVTPILSAPPDSDTVTSYDRAHFITYLKLLDADAMNIDWRQTVRTLLFLDPDACGDVAHRVYDAHLARARWMTRTGYRQLLQ